MIVRSLALAMLLAGTALASAATDDELKTQIVGPWGMEAECTDPMLVFNADGSFSLAGEDGEKRDGTYTIAGGKLNGKAGDTTMPEVSVSFDAGKLMIQGPGGDPDTLFKCKQ